MTTTKRTTKKKPAKGKSVTPSPPQPVTPSLLDHIAEDILAEVPF